MSRVPVHKGEWIIPASQVAVQPWTRELLEKMNSAAFECTECQTTYTSCNSARQCCQWDGRGWD